MKKVSELFEEIGFSKEGSNATKEAFIKHLIRVSTGQVVQTPTEAASKGVEKPKNLVEKPPKTTPFQQLSFDFPQDEKPDSRPASKVS